MQLTNFSSLLYALLSVSIPYLPKQIASVFAASQGSSGVILILF